MSLGLNADERVEREWKVELMVNLLRSNLSSEFGRSLSIFSFLGRRGVEQRRTCNRVPYDFGGNEAGTVVLKELWSSYSALVGVLV